MAQGFGLSKALPSDELLTFLEQHTSAPIPVRPAASPFRNVNK
jgi:hypothetical protein